MRGLVEPMRLGGYEIPAGTTVAPCIYLVHHREDIYPRPFSFTPERFLGHHAGELHLDPVRQRRAPLRGGGVCAAGDEAGDADGARRGGAGAGPRHGLAAGDAQLGRVRPGRPGAGDRHAPPDGQRQRADARRGVSAAGRGWIATVDLGMSGHDSMDTTMDPRASGHNGMDGKIDLLVVGAGAKATALAAKIHALNTLGAGPFALTIVEATELAASWLGRNGMTSGEEPLAIPPIKDIGFPYQSSKTFGELGEELDRAMMPFTWQQYMIGKGEYARWVNAGSPAVQHRDYGRYLTWVLSQATAGVTIVRGRVTQVSLPGQGERWRVEVLAPAGKRQYECDALVLTGPGVHRALPHDPAAAARIFHCDSRRGELARIPLEQSSDIAIVGGGESALSAVAFLRDFRPAARMTVYTPMLPLSRGESFLENRVFSNPDEVAWSALDLQTRRDFVKHCDRGVFDPGTLASIAYDDRCRFITGRVMHVGSHTEREGRGGVGGGSETQGRRRGVRRLRLGGGPHQRAPRLPDQLHRLRPAGAAARPLLPRPARGDRAPGGPGVGSPARSGGGDRTSTRAAGDAPAALHTGAGGAQPRAGLRQPRLPRAARQPRAGAAGARRERAGRAPCGCGP